MSVLKKISTRINTYQSSVHRGLTREEMAEVIGRHIHANGCTPRAYEWDDLENTTLDDPELEQIRVICVDIELDRGFSNREVKIVKLRTAMDLLLDETVSLLEVKTRLAHN